MKSEIEPAREEDRLDLESLVDAAIGRCSCAICTREFFEALVRSMLHRGMRPAQIRAAVSGVLSKWE